MNENNEANLVKDYPFKKKNEIDYLLYRLSSACSMTGGSYEQTFMDILQTCKNLPINKDALSKDNKDKHKVLIVSNELKRLCDRVFDIPGPGFLKFEDRILGHYDVGDEHDFFQMFSATSVLHATKKLMYPSPEDFKYSMSSVISVYKASIDHNEQSDRVCLGTLIDIFNLHEDGYYKLIYSNTTKLITYDEYVQKQKWILEANAEKPTGEMGPRPESCEKINTLTKLLEMYPEDLMDYAEVFTAVSYVYQVSTLFCIVKTSK